MYSLVLITSCYDFTKYNKVQDKNSSKSAPQTLGTTGLRNHRTTLTPSVVNEKELYFDNNEGTEQTFPPGPERRVCIFIFSVMQKTNCKYAGK